VAVDHATRMYVDVQQPPWRVVRAFPREDRSSLVHLHNVSGGVLSADRLRLSIDVGPGASAQVTTTGATRLYRHRGGLADSCQQVEIRLAEGAQLEYLPDPIIPFAGARHRQRTSVALADRSVLLWWETLAPGRQAMGETFAFDYLRIQAEVRTAARPLLIEDLILNPATRSLTSAARLGPYSHTASFYAFSPGLPASKWSELEMQIQQFCVARSNPGVMIWGSSTLAADGLAVRGLSVSAREVPATLAAIWKIAKRFLTGQDAILPRKVY
jgi:urease accessory protein